MSWHKYSRTAKHSLTENTFWVNKRLFEVHCVPLEFNLDKFEVLAVRKFTDGILQSK